MLSVIDVLGNSLSVYKVFLYIFNFKYFLERLDGCLIIIITRT